MRLLERRDSPQLTDIGPRPDQQTANGTVVFPDELQDEADDMELPRFRGQVSVLVP